MEKESGDEGKEDEVMMMGGGEGEKRKQKSAGEKMTRKSGRERETNGMRTERDARERNRCQNDGETPHALPSLSSLSLPIALHYPLPAALRFGPRRLPVRSSDPPRLQRRRLPMTSQRRRRDQTRRIYRRCEAAPAKARAGQRRVPRNPDEAAVPRPVGEAADHYEKEK